MPSVPSTPPEQFWLLTAEVPSGPFTVAQVHAELAAGRATWQTPACPVGGSTWLPLVQTPGIGPAAGRPDAIPGESAAKPPGPPPIPPRASTEEAMPSTDGTPAGESEPRPPCAEPATPEAGTPPSVATPATPKEDLVGAVIGIGILVLLLAGVGYGVYWVYEQLRPDTATEVCKKLDEAKTAAEAKKYATPRMHPLLDALFASKSTLDPNDAYEWTREIDGPRPNTKLVGFKGTTFVPEVGQRVRVEGHFVVVKSDGWKVDDAVLTGVEGNTLPGPISLVDEHHRSITAPKQPGSTGLTPRTTPSTTPKSVTPGGYTRQPRGVEALFLGIKERIGWGGIVAIGVLGSVW